MKIYAATVATRNEGYYNALVESCRRNEIDLVVLGFGQKWQGFAWRFLLMKDFIDSIDNDNDIVIFLDAFDIIAIQHVSIILKRFIEFNSPLVLSTEIKKDTYYMKYLRRRIFGHCDRADVCGGAYMGYVYALRILYSKICHIFGCLNPEFSGLDDQRILTSICNDNDFTDQYIRFDKNFYIFYTSPIFNSLNDKYYDIRGGRFYNKGTNISPCFIHSLNNVNMDHIVDLYNLPKPNDKHRSYFWKTIRHQIKFFKLEIIIIIFLIFGVWFLLQKYKKCSSRKYILV